MSTWQATVRAAASFVVLMSGENSAKPTQLREGTVHVFCASLCIAYMLDPATQHTVFFSTLKELLYQLGWTEHTIKHPVRENSPGWGEALGSLGMACGALHARVINSQIIKAVAFS